MNIEITPLEPDVKIQYLVGDMINRTKIQTYNIC